MYLIEIDGSTYEKKGGDPFGLVEALREVYGVRGARVLRLDGTVAVDRAGSSTELVHLSRTHTAPRRIARRLTTTGRRRWIADMAARSPHRFAA